MRIRDVLDRKGREVVTVSPGGTVHEAMRVLVEHNIGAVIVMDESTCMVKAAMRVSRFYYAESCGQCTPCREGTGWMHRIIKRIEEGQGRPEDLDLLLSAADQIAGKTICAFGEAAAWPVQGFLRHFRDEFEYHIAHKRCLVGGTRTAGEAA